jgi:hypothetical protein
MKPDIDYWIEKVETESMVPTAKRDEHVKSWDETHCRQTMANPTTKAISRMFVVFKRPYLLVILRSEILIKAIR